MENDVVYSIENGQWVEKDKGKDNDFSPAQISSFILGKLKTFICPILKRL